MNIIHLRCEYRNNPLGIDTSRPRLSWQLDSHQRGTRQTAYQVVCRESFSLHPTGDDSTETGLLWDSGIVPSDQSVHIPYNGSLLGSRQRVYWWVRIRDQRGEPTEWSDPAWFEMGLLDQVDWQAKWIRGHLTGGPRTPVPSPFFRRGFTIEQPIQSARLYITSLGIYEVYINSQRVGEDFFTPGWTDYGKRVQYQVYDVTGKLTTGSNMLGAILGDGWYCGNLGWSGRQQYGDRPKLLAQLEVNLVDGSRQVIVTDDSWQTTTGPLLEADLIMGETYDARLEIPNWCSHPAVGEAHNWFPVIVCPHISGMALVAQNGPTVRIQGELVPVAEPTCIKEWPQDKWIFDFGQNLVGRARLKIRGERGTTITLRFGEALDEKGNLYTENLRTARQTDYYTLKGDSEGEVYEPHFTFHGFRYVELIGHPGLLSVDALTAVVLHSSHPTALEFECSAPLVNKLQHNIEWGWKGNSVDIPTDCPQRDERLGWTGDAQVFVKTATYLTDSAGFFTKWIQDMADSQFDYGAIPSFAPRTAALQSADGGAAWSDAFIIVPWTIWQQYGDTRILEVHYDAMCRYMDYLVGNSPGFIRLLPNQVELGDNADQNLFGGYGDWLAQDGSSDTRRGLTPRDLIGTAFLAYDCLLMSQMAAALNKPDDQAMFIQFFEDTRWAFTNRFLTPAGLMAGGTQTAYILALHFGLVSGAQFSTIAGALVKDIVIDRDMHMSTGFVGTPYICQVLTDLGRLDLAYDLLFQHTAPSWLFSVLNGATTIWERWDSWTPEDGFQDPGMNSFNHYAYGAVGTWMYENITGIRTDSAQPGFKHAILQPRIGPGLTCARGIYRTPYGLIKSHWWFESDTLIWEVTVPPNTSATAYVPAGESSQVLEGGGPAENSPGVATLRRTPDAAVFDLQSGSYHFEVIG